MFEYASPKRNDAAICEERKGLAPQAGLEPATLRLPVQRRDLRLSRTL